MSMPPVTPSTSANTVSRGSTSTSATILGSTSNSMGSMPSVRSASISSVTAMVPIWAAQAEPERPAMMIAVISGANSRSMDRPTRSATKMFAPYWRN